MKPDYKRFTQNREIFPRGESSNSNGLMCGHLNRLKFPINIDSYLNSRTEGVCMSKALARANRCFCKADPNAKNPVKEELNKIENNFEETKNLVETLESIEIIVPKQKER